MKDLFIYTNPSDVAVVLRTDADGDFIGKPDVEPVSGRSGFRVSFGGIDMHNGWGANLRITKADYTPVSVRGILWLDRPGIGNYAEFIPDDYTLVPFESRVLPRLVARGHVFQQADGKRFTVIGCSDFNILGLYATHPEMAEQVIRQRAKIGFNMLRVFTLMHLSQFGIGDLDPCPYDKIAGLCRLCAKYGLYVCFVGYTSTFDTGHWNRLGEACKSSTNALLSLVNENDQPANTIDPRAYQPIAGVLCSHGSNGSQQLAVRPVWDWEGFHTNGALEEQRKIGHNAMEMFSGTEDWAPGGAPVVTEETSRCLEVGMWVGASAERARQLAYDSAAGAALLCSGSCFHSVQGKASRLWTGIELEAATAWAQGAKSVPLEFQDGRYVRVDDPAFLRTYQRVLPDGRAWTVQIRK